MPKPKDIWYCVDNCGPGRKYRNKCPYHYGMSIAHIGLDHYNDGRITIFATDWCVASGGVRQKIALKKEPEYAEE